MDTRKDLIYSQTVWCTYQCISKSWRRQQTDGMRHQKMIKISFPLNQRWRLWRGMWNVSRTIPPKKRQSPRIVPKVERTTKRVSLRIWPGCSRNRQILKSPRCVMARSDGGAPPKTLASSILESIAVTSLKSIQEVPRREEAMAPSRAAEIISIWKS